MALFPLSLCEIQFYRRPDSDLGKLTEATQYQTLSDLLENPYKSTISFFLVDVLKQCLQTDQSDPALYYYVENTIIKLDEVTDINLFVLSFLLDFSGQLGISPNLSFENQKYFHLQEGEFSDQDRIGEINAAGDSVSLIQNLLRKEGNFHYPKQTIQESFETILLYYKLHIPRFDVQKSLEVIREILYT